MIVIDAKRMIGRRFEDRTLAADMKTWPFHVVNQAGRPMVRVTQGGEVKLYHPEEISAMVLGALRAAAAAYLGAEVTRCVVTVPAHFGDAQRLATKDAATIAGLDVTRVINEPTAGALAYGLGEPEGDERNVLIYDLGGGTFDVTVLTIEEGVFEVRATCGDTHLGGQDFDTRLCAHLAEEFVRKHPDCDLVADKKAMLRLRTACDKAKRQLSGATECSIQLDNLQTGVDFSTSLSRSSFEVLNEDLFRLTLTLVDRVLKDAEVDKKDIHEVVLVGGSTRIPMVQRLLREFFDGKELNSSLNPDEAVARGAALQAAILNGDLSERVQDLVLLDVTPLSLGVDIVEGITSTIVERNSAIPIKNTVTFYTATDNQTNVVVTVFEGERMMSKNNTELGSFTLNGIPPGQAETQAVDVTFEIDSDGILNVTAVVKSTSKEMKVTIAGNRGRLSADHIEKLVQEAALYLEQDKKSKEIALAKSALEYYCLHMTSRAKKSWIPASVKQIILELCTETLQWLASNQNVSKESLGEKLQELKQMFPSLK